MQKIIAFTIVLALSADAPKIEIEKSDSAPGHSGRNGPEPLERHRVGGAGHRGRGRQFFLQDRVARQQGVRSALDPEATTNLFIWTASGRLSYELVPAPAIAEMHFAIDQESVINHRPFEGH